MLRALGITLLGLGLMVPAAEAKDHGHKRGHAYGHRKHVQVVRQRNVVVRPVRFVDRDGNTRRVVRTTYVIGRPLPTTVRYRYAEPYVITRYRPAPYGYRYVVVDDKVLLMNVATRVIANALFR